MNTDEIKSLIENGLSTSFVNVVGDGTHFEAIIVSNQFEDKRRFQLDQSFAGILNITTEINQLYEVLKYQFDQWK